MPMKLKPVLCVVSFACATRAVPAKWSNDNAYNYDSLNYDDGGTQDQAYDYEQNAAVQDSGAFNGRSDGVQDDYGYGFQQVDNEQQQPVVNGYRASTIYRQTNDDEPSVQQVYQYYGQPSDDSGNTMMMQQSPRAQQLAMLESLRNLGLFDDEEVEQPQSVNVDDIDMGFQPSDDAMMGGDGSDGSTGGQAQNSYPSPPNPCPKGVKSVNCIKDQPDTAEFSRMYQALRSNGEGKSMNADMLNSFFQQM